MRFLIVGLVVAASIALGFLFHLNVAEYQLLGIPILLVFQSGIHRQPLRTLWVRSGPSLRLDAWFFFSLFPVYAVSGQQALCKMGKAQKVIFQITRKDGHDIML